MSEKKKESYIGYALVILMGINTLLNLPFGVKLTIDIIGVAGLAWLLLRSFRAKRQQKTK
ncbi:hypothetical protein [Levilactobacillus sp. HBUAS70063]|uniref:hypothetical protein n=1 Tax=Levilactobacillus sp. HBUAS70063 TaxID=3109359 RepID=UPI0031331A4F